MPRKYIKLKAREIIPLAQELINKKDYANLAVLENEIGFRRRAAKILEPTLNDIKEFLINKRSDLEASSDAFTVSEISPLSLITSTLEDAVR